MNIKVLRGSWAEVIKLQSASGVLTSDISYTCQRNTITKNDIPALLHLVICAVFCTYFPQQFLSWLNTFLLVRLKVSDNLLDLDV